MGRAAIRSAATAYLTAANIPSVGNVFSARPTIIDEEDYEVSISGSMLNYIVTENGSGSVLIVNLPNSDRTRETLTGYGGFVDDINKHEIVLELILANTDGDAVAAQDDHDAACDAITTAIRADPTMGTAGNPQAIFGTAVFERGVQVEQSMPFSGADGMTVFILGVIRFEAWEWTSGIGV